MLPEPQMIFHRKVVDFARKWLHQSEFPIHSAFAIELNQIAMPTDSLDRGPEGNLRDFAVCLPHCVALEPSQRDRPSPLSPRWRRLLLEKQETPQLVSEILSTRARPGSAHKHG